MKRMKPKVIRRLTVMTAMVLTMLVFAAPAWATTFTVDRNDDADPTTAKACTTAGGDCSLRGAIITANAATGTDAITVPAGTYTLSRAGAGEDAASTGDLDLTGDLTITGAGARATSVAGVGGELPFDDRIFDVEPDVTTTITSLTMTGGQPAGGGTDGEGGGVQNEGDLTLGEVAVKDNTADVAGGIESFNGTLNITDSTVSGNSATANVGGVLQTRGTANITNSTISGNHASSFNGGVAASSGALMNILNSTIVSNTSSRLGGGILTDGAGVLVTVKNTIVAGNSPNNCDTAQLSGGIISSQGNNISSDDICDFTKSTDRQDTNPRLGQLANNGGPTDTRALLEGSPAVDAGNQSACPLRDQRGIARKDGDGDGTLTCDIGAFEAPTNTRPTITNLKPIPGSSTHDRTPSIAATVRDAQTDLAQTNIKLFVDGNRKNTFSYERSTDHLSYASGRLSFGKHTVKIVADDLVLSATRSWSFKVVRG